MPDKPKKKPKHTKLALPTDKKRDAHKKPAAAPDRLGRKVNGSVAGREDSRPKQAANVAHGAVPGARAGVPPPNGHDVPQTAEAAQGAKAGPAQGPPVGTGDSAETVAPAVAPANGETAQAAAPNGRKPAGLPDNTIVLPQKRPGISKAKRRKRRRRLGFLAFVLAVAMLMLFYFSGLYLNAAMGLGDLYDTARIALTPGDGFPMDFAMTGFWRAEELGAGGFAALGSKDMAVFSGTGAELRRIQHGYANPGITASDTRVCVYSRGGRD